MGRCQAKTKRGKRCKNLAVSGKAFCSIHKDCFDAKSALAISGGAIVGHMISPGIGGVLLGGLAGHVAKRSIKRKTKVFISFDYENDRKLKEFIVGQAKMPDSPFEVIDHSLKEAAPEATWEMKADRAIARADLVIVMVGRYTYKAHGVLKEVAMANRRNKRIVQIIGYRNRKYTPVRNAGKLYRWNWNNLKKLLS